MNIDLLPERIAKKIEPEPMSGCWLWTAYQDPDGYGRLNCEKTPRLAHRVVYEILVGPIPEGLELDHLCRNTGCVSPWHLEAVTYHVNRWRGLRGGSQTHCRNGHLYDEANIYLYRGQRNCRMCKRLGNRKRYLAKRAAS